MMALSTGGVLVALASFVLTFLVVRAIRRRLNARQAKDQAHKAGLEISQQSRQVRRAQQRQTVG